MKKTGKKRVRKVTTSVPKEEVKNVLKATEPQKSEKKEKKKVAKPAQEEQQPDSKKVKPKKACGAWVFFNMEYSAQLK